MSKKAILLSMLLLLITAGVIVAVAEANPVWEPSVHTVSPAKDKIYFTTNVELKFENSSDRWFSSIETFSYVLDGQAPVKLNSTNTMMNNLSPGNHHLILYGDGTVLDYVYFSIYYSVPILIFVLITLPVLAIISFVVIKKRTQIRGRINETSSKFWWGLGLFVLSAISIAPLTIIWISHFLFPSSTVFSHFYSSCVSFFMGGLFLMFFISIPLMFWGARKNGKKRFSIAA
jgi:hypothetical protein